MNSLGNQRIKLLIEILISFDCSTYHRTRKNPESTNKPAANKRKGEC